DRDRALDLPVNSTPRCPVERDLHRYRAVACVLDVDEAAIAGAIDAVRGFARGFRGRKNAPIAPIVVEAFLLEGKDVLLRLKDFGDRHFDNEDGIGIGFRALDVGRLCDLLWRDLDLRHRGSPKVGGRTIPPQANARAINASAADGGAIFNPSPSLPSA